MLLFIFVLAALMESTIFVLSILWVVGVASFLEHEINKAEIIIAVKNFFINKNYTQK